MAGAAGAGACPGAAGGDGDDSLYPIAVLIDELRNEDVQVLGWGRGAEVRAEALTVGSGKAGSAMEATSGGDRAIFRAATGRGGDGGGPRRSVSARRCPLLTLWGSGAQQWAGSQFPPQEASAGGLRGRPGAEERSGAPGAFEVAWSVCPQANWSGWLSGESATAD